MEDLFIEFKSTYSILLSLFRTNQFFANALLVIYALLIWSPSFFISQAALSSDGTFIFDTLATILPATGSIANSLIAALLALVQAIILNLMVSRYRLTEEITLFPGLFYLLFMGFSGSFWTVNPLLIANFFLIFAIIELVETYKEFSSADRIYNIGLFIGIASLCYFSYIVFLVSAWIGIGILRAIRWKERLILLFGFFSPYFLVFTYQFWNDHLSDFISQEIGSNFHFFSYSPYRGYDDLITLVLVMTMLIIAVFSYKLYTYKKKIKIQKIIDLLYWGIAATIISILFQAQINVQHFLMLLPILAIFVSINFVHMSRQWSEILHMLLLAGLLIWHYIPLLKI